MADGSSRLVAGLKQPSVVAGYVMFGRSSWTEHEFRNREMNLSVVAPTGLGRSIVSQLRGAPGLASWIGNALD
jgi:hypothetical protein